MMIKAKEGGNIIHADDEEAKQLIEAGIYEAYDGTENNTTQPPVEPKPTKRPKAR
jgi:hypothetical protein